MFEGCEDILESEEDKLRDECGVVGIFLKSQKGAETAVSDPYSTGDFNAATQAYYGLCSLQHRGQDSAGIAVSDGSSINVHKGMGTAAEVFKVEDLASLKGLIACGHVRYATAGSATLENAQPIVHKITPIEDKIALSESFVALRIMPEPTCVKLRLEGKEYDMKRSGTKWSVKVDNAQAGLNRMVVSPEGGVVQTIDVEFYGLGAGNINDMFDL